MHGVLVTGLGGGRDATLTAAALARSRPGAVYVKPVQTGGDGGPPDVEVVAGLAGCAVRQGRAFGDALPPAVAARRAGVALRRADLLAPFNGLDVVVGQGVGGLLVELGTDGTTLADLATDLDLPLVVACPPGPGTLNVARLTVEAAWARGIAVLGLVLTCWPTDPDLGARSDADALGAMAPVLGVLPDLPGPPQLPEVAW